MALSRPLIGVTGSARRGQLMTALNRFALWRAGARSQRYYPGKKANFSGIDGLLIGGGDDIDVRLYDQELVLETRIDPERDALELAALEHAMAQGLPVLGICRGSQILNVFLGGSLHPDIYALFVDLPRQRTVLPAKWVDITGDSRLSSILACARCKVNSLHHQAVDRLGKGLRPVAHDEAGIIQAVEDPHHPFLLGVQWHPEFLIFDRGQQELFRRLVEAARDRAAGHSTPPSAGHRTDAAMPERGGRLAAHSA